jgi:hypothetical protein
VLLGPVAGVGAAAAGATLASHLSSWVLPAFITACGAAAEDVDVVTENE